MNTNTMNEILEKVEAEVVKASPEVKKITFFSLLSGEMYEVESDEIKTLDKYQIPLTQRPPNCRKCYGRMHLGKNITIGAYVMCPKCARKYVDFNLLKFDEIDVETTKADMQSAVTG